MTKKYKKHFCGGEKLWKPVCKECKDDNWRKDKTLLKHNAIEIAKEHKKHCKREKCKCSLVMLGLLIERAGIKLTKNQWKEFA